MATPTSKSAQAAAQAAFEQCGIYDGTQASDPSASPAPLADGSVNAAFQPSAPPRKSPMQ